MKNRNYLVVLLLAVIVFYLLCIHTLFDYVIISVVLTIIYLVFWIYVMFFSKSKALKYLSLIYSSATVIFGIILFMRIPKTYDAVVAKWFFTILFTLFAVPFNGLRIIITDSDKLLETGLIISFVWLIASVVSVIKIKNKKEEK